MTTHTLIGLAIVMVLTLILVMIPLAFRSKHHSTKHAIKTDESYIVPSEVDLDTFVWSDGYNRIKFRKGDVLIGNASDHSTEPTNYNSKYACDSTFPDDYDPEVINTYYETFPGTVFVSNLNRKSLSRSQSSCY